MKNYHNTRLSRRSVKNIQIIQGGQDLTAQAGLIPVVKFLKKHGFASKIEQTRNKLTPDAFGLRLIDKVAVKGKEDPVLIHEVLDAEVPEERDGKLATLETFCTGWELYQNQSFGGRAVCRPVAESSTLRKRIFAGVTSTISPSRMNSIARSKVIGIIGVNTTFSSFPEAR